MVGASINVMAEKSLEDLLQEALADFDEPKQGPDVSAVPFTSKKEGNIGSSSGPPVATQTVIKHVEELPSPTLLVNPAPKALGLGLGGLDLPGRRPRKPPGAAVAILGSASEVEKEGKVRDKTGASGFAKPTLKLPAEAQRLADDLVSLLQETGLGEDAEGSDAAALSACLAELTGAAGNMPTASTGLPALLNAGAAGLPGLAPAPRTELGTEDPFAQLFGRIMGGLAPSSGHGGSGEGPPPPPPEFAAILQQMMMGTADMPSGAEMRPPGPLPGPGGTPVAGPLGTPAAGADDDDALASSRLAGLAQRTRKMVSEQAKNTRGHTEGAAGGRTGAGAAAGMFGLGGGGSGIGGLASVLRELGCSGTAGGGIEGEEGAAPPPAGVSMMVDYVMQHLLSKDVLYGPLKEIRDRYPPWLEVHQGTLPAEDYRRYVAQYESVQRVCSHYETSPSDFSTLMDLIQEMQTYGDPPGDIVEEMTGGAGRDINAILDGTDAEFGGQPDQQPALEELSNELDKCKVQ